MNPRIVVFCAFLLVIGVLLRIYPGLHDIIFPYDQARDVLVMKRMVEQRDPILLGPVSDISGVHHGPIFYYLMAPLYALGKWDLALPLLGLIVLTMLGTIPLFWITKNIFGKPAAYIAVGLFFVSFEMVSYARWLSNPVLAIPLMPVLLWTMWKLRRSYLRPAFFTGLVFGLMVQAELVLVYLAAPIAFWFVKRKANIQQWAGLVGGIIAGLLPLVIAEFKFHFQALRGIAQYVGAHGNSLQTSAKITQMFLEYLKMENFITRNTLFGFPGWIPIVLFMIGIWYLWKKEKTVREGMTLLLITILSPFFLLITGKAPEKFFLIGIGVPVIMLAAGCLRLLYKQKRFLIGGTVLFFILASQLALIFQQAREHRAYVQVQRGVLLSERERVLDAIYTRIPPRTSFTVSVFGTPYGTRSAWAYYFLWYRLHHDVVTPMWYGFAANGYVGDEILPKVDAPAQTHVVIYEPEFDIAPQYVEQFAQYQDEHTVLDKEFEVSYHRIQLRHPKVPRSIL